MQTPWVLLVEDEVLIAEMVVRVPVVFATGYAMAAGNARGHAQAIDKPSTKHRLARALSRAMAVPKAAGTNA